MQKIVDFNRFVLLQMKWIKLKHQQCDNFFYNNKTKHNSVQTFCQTPGDHLQEPKKDNKKLAQPQNQAQFGSDILSNTRQASSRTKKENKFIKTKPSSDQLLREREKTENKPTMAGRERERERENTVVGSAPELRWAVLRWVAAGGSATR
jgi:hypothetical protein